MIADSCCVPLLGVQGARSQVYATAAVLAGEQHIAETAEHLAAQPAAHLDDSRAEAAIGLHETARGIGLNVGQRHAAHRLLTSGAELDLVVGVAGSGKTTLLAAVRAGFETVGYQVLGVATSGQAARGLAEGAGIAESRTVASLQWRLDHDQVTLTDRHVIVLDEAGMTDDADLGAILAAAQRAGAKLIVAGDDRQLGAVGPGGGLAALLARYPERVVRLDENVRQHDPGERRALAELRAGSVERAVAWYANRGWIRSGTDGAETIGWMVAAWADDIVAGRDSLLLAWQRVDVAELNERARAAYAALGYLTGPEIQLLRHDCRDSERDRPDPSCRHSVPRSTTRQVTARRSHLCPARLPDTPTGTAPDRR